MQSNFHTRRAARASRKRCPYCGLKALVDWIFMGIVSNDRLYCTACFRFTDRRGNPINPVKTRVVS